MKEDRYEIERELELEDEIFEEDDNDITSDATLLDIDPEERFVQESIDPDDIATGFSATIPTREIDVDEDTQGDEELDAGGEEPLAQFEASSTAQRFIHGDEIELDLDEVLATGRTVAEAPKDD